jgi:hypothetical protein
MGGCQTELLHSHNAGRRSRARNLGKGRSPERNVLAVGRKRNPRGKPSPISGIGGWRFTTALGDVAEQVAFGPGLSLVGVNQDG